MTDWRALMKSELAYTQYAHNPQKGTPSKSFEDFGDNEYRHAKAQPAPAGVHHNREVATLVPGNLISWRAMDGKTYGPAVVEHVTFCDGRTWAWVTWEGLERAVCEVLITTVEPGASHHE